MRVATLSLSITYDETETSAEDIAEALDRLLVNAMSTEGILAEYGDPEVGEIAVDGDYDAEVSE